jgi:hypothetical protein
MKIKALLLLLALSAPAFATKPKDPPTPPINVQQEQGQIQQQQMGQAQDQDQNQTQSMGSQENSQSVSFSSARQVHSAIAPSIQSSNPCVIGGSGALGLKGVNIGGGKQKVDPECEKRETARILGALGERELAVLLVCSTEAAKDGLGDNCAPSVTQIELRERIDKLLMEREHDRLVCNSSKDKIIEACKK